MAIEIGTAKYYSCSSLRTQYNPKFQIVIVLVKIAYTKTNPIATPCTCSVVECYCPMVGTALDFSLFIFLS